MNIYQYQHTTWLEPCQSKPVWSPTKSALFARAFLGKLKEQRVLSEPGMFHRFRQDPTGRSKDTIAAPHHQGDCGGGLKAVALCRGEIKVIGR